ncbi:hypothetical protein WN51_12684 [Melipona quadrifasciata]|uniref:Uncharacterized protein n=1 Tax=Melipona quadrifasciata TaxID=166423 RepID=A0A0M9A0R8_9HYME|nr:hypothetical protein WN51_12684 [Melipona quadrifasciata]
MKHLYSGMFRQQNIDPRSLEVPSRARPLTATPFLANFDLLKREAPMAAYFTLLESKNEYTELFDLPGPARSLGGIKICYPQTNVRLCAELLSAATGILDKSRARNRSRLCGSAAYTCLAVCRRADFPGKIDLQLYASRGEGYHRNKPAANSNGNGFPHQPATLVVDSLLPAFPVDHDDVHPYSRQNMFLPQREMCDARESGSTDSLGVSALTRRRRRQMRDTGVGASHATQLRFLTLLKHRYPLFAWSSSLRFEYIKQIIAASDFTVIDDALNNADPFFTQWVSVDRITVLWKSDKMGDSFGESIAICWGGSPQVYTGTMIRAHVAVNKADWGEKTERSKTGKKDPRTFPGDVLAASGGEEEERTERREDGHRPSTYSNQCIQLQYEEATCSQLWIQFQRRPAS